MNDLERDLTSLFHDTADRLEVPGRPPQAVLRRGRRRQWGTALLGGLTVIAMVGVALAGFRVIVGDPDPVPAERREILGERTVRLGPLALTAPAGWTLLDLTGLAANLAVESCSVAVDSDGGTAETCDPVVPSPGGVPLLQLSNFDPGPESLLCPVGDQGARRIIGGQAALYVGWVPEGVTVAEALAATETSCAPDAHASTVTPLELDDGMVVVVTAAGAEATDADRARLQAVTDRLVVDPSVSFPQPTPGWASYVIAAGVDGGAAWRALAFDFDREAWAVSAVIDHIDRDGNASRSSGVLVGGFESQRATEMGSLESMDLGDGSAVIFGYVPSGMAAATYLAPSGDEVEAPLIPVPEWLRSLDTLSGSTDGSIVAFVTSEPGGEVITNPVDGGGARTTIAPLVRRDIATLQAFGVRWMVTTTTGPYACAAIRVIPGQDPPVSGGDSIGCMNEADLPLTFRHLETSHGGGSAEGFTYWFVNGLAPSETVAATVVTEDGQRWEGVVLRPEDGWHDLPGALYIVPVGSGGSARLVLRAEGEELPYTSRLTLGTVDADPGVVSVEPVTSP
jgi:hypothetical protein